MSMPADILEAGPPKECDIALLRGDSQRIRATIRRKDTRAPIDLAGVTAVSLIFYDVAGKGILQTIAGQIASPTTLGQVFIDLTPAETAALPFLPPTDTSDQANISALWTLAVIATDDRKTVGRGRVLVISPTDV